MLRVEMEGREGLAIGCGGGAMLCRLVVDGVEGAAEEAIEARLPGGPDILWRGRGEGAVTLAGLDFGA